MNSGYHLVKFRKIIRGEKKWKVKKKYGSKLIQFWAGKLEWLLKLIRLRIASKWTKSLLPPFIKFWWKMNLYFSKLSNLEMANNIFEEGVLDSLKRINFKIFQKNLWSNPPYLISLINKAWNRHFLIQKFKLTFWLHMWRMYVKQSSNKVPSHKHLEHTVCCIPSHFSKLIF